MNNDENIPTAALRYVEAIKGVQSDAFVTLYFYQVAALTLLIQGHQIDFYALEFRDRVLASLIWRDQDGNWRAGRWIRVPNPGGV